MFIHAAWRRIRYALIWGLLDRCEREGLVQLSLATWGAHYVDLAVRRGGRDELRQADFLKPLARIVGPVGGGGRVSDGGSLSGQVLTEEVGRISVVGDPPTTSSGCWTRCEDCGEFWCLRHEAHVADCACPPIEEWPCDPYVGGAMKFRKKPVVIEAHQWFMNGDHPEDGGPGEGRVVRYFRRPDVSGEDACPECKDRFHDHGWIDTLEGGHRVCPGDWIITGVKGERYPCKPDIFEATYEPVLS